tara:strand:- start:405 stop:866 length:462 start_codon:yes stop_codon:yes gene_type:complete
MSIFLKINGLEKSFDGDPRTPLVDVLRNSLNLTGAKPVCREGFCGACIVLIDEKPICSCLKPVGELNNMNISTVEGLSSYDKLNSLQKKFEEFDVVQCGMCFPGIVVKLTNFLKKNNKPSEKEIRKAFVGNICRCTGYERIIDAINSLVNEKK